MNKIVYLCIGIIVCIAALGIWQADVLHKYLPPSTATNESKNIKQDISTETAEESSIISVIYLAQDTTLFVTFNNTDETVTFTHTKTGKVTLPSAISGSGARYTNSDETIEFWEHQGVGTLSLHGAAIFTGSLAADTPSREPYEGCVWKKTTGAGLEFWGQSCDYGEKKLEVNVSETLPGVFLEDVTSGSPVAVQELIRVFELPKGVIEDVLPVLADDMNWNTSDLCAFTKQDSHKTGISKYTLMPTGAALAKFEADGKNEPILDTCAGYGMGNSGVHYFEIHDSNPNKALFIQAGQEAPLFDENTIIVK